VAGAGDPDDRPGRLDAAPHVGDPQHRQHRRELLVSHHQLGQGRLERRDQHLRGRAGADPGSVGDQRSVLADHVGVEPPHREHVRRELLTLLLGEHVGALARHVPQQLVGHRLLYDQHRLVGAEHGVVEGLGLHDAGGG
jgi:hypothetical protein